MHDRFDLTVAALMGQPWPALPALPSRRFNARDEPLTEAELADVTDPTELARLTGISKAAAIKRLAERAARARNNEGTP